MIALLAGCNPGGGEGEGNTDCAAGQTFNRTSRTCVPTNTIAFNPAPTATLNTVNINEDTAAIGDQVVLTYTVPAGRDLATSCTVNIDPVAVSNLVNGLGGCQCLGGTCYTHIHPTTTNPNFFGTTGFTYTVTNSDGTSNEKVVTVNIVNVDDPPTIDYSGATSFVINQQATTPASPTVAAENTTVNITSLQYEDLDGDLATACSVSNIEGGMVASACTCTAGVCAVSMTGGEEVPLAGVTRNFDYDITANGVTTATGTYAINWTFVDDPPTIRTPITSASLTGLEDSVGVPSITVDFYFTDEEDLFAGGDTCTASSNSASLTLVGCNCTVGQDDCQVSFNYDQDFFGSPTFDLAVDVNGVKSASETVTLSILEVNDAPTTTGEPTLNQYTDAGGGALQQNEALEVIFQVDEGGGPLEDTQDLYLQLVSGNNTVVPTASTNLYIAWDPGTGTFTDLGYDGSSFVKVETASTDAACAGCRVKLTIIPDRDASTGPAGGTTPVTMTLNLYDDGGTANGGDDDSAITFNVDWLEFNDPPTIALTDVTSTGTYCKYSLARNQPVDCPGTGCQGAGAPPQGTMPATPTQANLIYYDTNGFCYLSEVGSWSLMGSDADGFVTCPISSSDEATTCAALGASCIGSGAPTIAVAAGDEFFYWDKTNHQCYRSNGGVWSTFAVVTEKNLNERDTFIYKNIQFDEGANDEDTQELLLTVTSNNTSLVNNANIILEKDGNSFATGPIAGLALDGAGAVDASTSSYILKVLPSSGVTGSASITVTITENNALPTNLVTQVKFNVTVNPVSAIHGRWKNVSAVGHKVDGDGTKLSDAEITLEWNNFTLLSTGGATITGWNIYRRASSTASEMDYDTPLNTTTIPAGTFTYTDTFSTLSVAGGTQGEVYFYEVRPIDSLFNNPTASSPDLSYKEIRVVRPPNNTTFVHRWMVNQDICGKLNSTTDPDENFRCPYTGPGEISTGSDTFYDISHDFIVDTYEAGCDFNGPGEFGVEGTNSCLDPDGCIGVGSPTGEADFDPADTALNYYDRGSGKCSYRVGGEWVEYTSVDIAANTVAPQRMPFDTANVPSLPPLTNISQSQANLFCNQRTGYTIVQDGTNGTAGGPAQQDYYKHRVALRKEQVAFASWHPDLTDAEIDSRETGISINATPNCNSSQASGYGTFYEDTGYPSLANIFTLPGTLASSIRSVITGSDVTTNCKSRYGLQDIVGNVDEWVLDRIYCPTLTECEGLTASTTRNFCTYESTNTVETNCSTAGCIGLTSPVADALTAVEGSVAAGTGNAGGAIYRDRFENTCYRAQSTTAGDWVTLDQRGCPVTLDCSTAAIVAPATGSMSCIGDGDPNAAGLDVHGSNDGASISFFLDYTTGNCWQNTTAGTRGNTWTLTGDPLGQGDPPYVDYIASSTGFLDSDFVVSDASFTLYRFDGITGPCNEGGNGVCDSDFLTAWILNSESFNAGRFFLPMGLPAHNDIPTRFTTSTDLNSSLLEIGPASGISSTALHNDTYTINSNNIFGGDRECGSLSAGGSYLDGSGAGNYSLEATRCYDTDDNSPIRGFRCVTPVQY